MAALLADVAAKSSSVAGKSEYKTAFWEENSNIFVTISRQGCALAARLRPEAYHRNSAPVHREAIHRPVRCYCSWPDGREQ